MKSRQGGHFQFRMLRERLIGQNFLKLSGSTPPHDLRMEWLPHPLLRGQEIKARYGHRGYLCDSVLSQHE